MIGTDHGPKGGDEINIIKKMKIMVGCKSYEFFIVNRQMIKICIK